MARKRKAVEPAELPLDEPVTAPPVEEVSETATVTVPEVKGMMVRGNGRVIFHVKGIATTYDFRGHDPVLVTDPAAIAYFHDNGYSMKPVE